MDKVELNIFGACVSCPAKEYGSEDRTMDCAVKHLMEGTAPKTLNKIKSLNTDEAEIIAQKCKECCVSRYLQQTG
jgi:hypothetical protein